MWFATEGSDGVGDAGSDVIGKKVYGGGWGRRWERWGREGGGGGLRAFWFWSSLTALTSLGHHSETLGREKGTADSDCLSSVIRRIGVGP